MSKKFDLIPAVFTPMSEDGNINPAGVESYAQYLYTNGMSTVFINGSTGESLSVTVEERKRMAEEWVSVNPQNMRIINHVGHNSLPAAKELAHHAQQLKVHAISVMTPTFLKPACDDDLIDFLTEIAREAPDTPFYFYYIPSMSQLYLNIPEFLGKAVQRIPTFVGLKYTHNDLLEFRTCIVEWGEKLNLLFGRDELLIHALTAGVTGGIGTTFNFLGPLYFKLVAAFHAGQLEKAWLIADKTTAFTKLLVDFGLLSIGKTFMKELGVNCGDIRLPLTPEPEEKFDQFVKEISKLELDSI